ncbi:MAG: hypothetical protein OXC72_08425, partial [Roseovarius sp.]|nr:hypothetical protein [Roseovarius sp.]
MHDASHAIACLPGNSSVQEAHLHPALTNATPISHGGFRQVFCNCILTSTFFWKNFYFQLL